MYQPLLMLSDSRRVNKMASVVVLVSVAVSMVGSVPL
jgi:hypothetical protein